MDHLENAIFDGPLNKMVLYVDVFGAGMVVPIGGQTLHCLIVAV